MRIFDIRSMSLDFKILVMRASCPPWMLGEFFHFASLKINKNQLEHLLHFRYFRIPYSLNWDEILHDCPKTEIISNNVWSYCHRERCENNNVTQNYIWFEFPFWIWIKISKFLKSILKFVKKFVTTFLSFLLWQSEIR